MSSHPHFPIISTSPPPLDITEDNEDEEEEEDLGSFNVLPENEIDFNDIDLSFKNNVIQNTAKNPNLKDDDSLVKKESFDNRIDENESNDKEIKSHNCINNISINCDNNIAIELNVNNDSIDDKISLKSIEFVDIDCTLSAEELNTENSINYDKNSFVKNEDFEESVGQELGNDLKVEDNKEEELKDSFGDNNSEKLEDYPQDDNDFVDENNDFADFTSFKLTDSEEMVAAVESEKQIYAKEDQSFGDFNSSNFNNLQGNYNNSYNEESDDDFADFASAEPVMHPIETVSNSNKNSLTSPSNDGEFADFSSFKDNNEIESKQELDIQSGFESNKLSALFIETFHNSKTLDSNENPIIISRDLFHSAEPNSISLWKSVQNLEEAPSLKLRWPSSHSFQLLLAALKIDPRNILRNSSVPMFASGLGHVLEPTKHTINSDIVENPNESNESITESTNSLSSTPIPPVQFDWSTSGLTNPLDANQKSMTPFDLDFFVTNDDVQNINKQTAISSFEQELLNDKIETNSKTDSISGDLDSTNDRTNIVQQLLSSIKSTSASTKQISDRNQVLSAEALQVLDELPNLSFMRAKVLMFPIINIKTDSN